MFSTHDRMSGLQPGLMVALSSLLTLLMERNLLSDVPIVIFEGTQIPLHMLSSVYLPGHSFLVITMDIVSQPNLNSLVLANSDFSSLTDITHSIHCQACIHFGLWTLPFPSGWSGWWSWRDCCSSWCLGPSFTHHYGQYQGTGRSWWIYSQGTI